MESSPLFREVRLAIQDPEDVRFAVKILQGKISVSDVAELKGQDQSLFDGDGDVLVLSYCTCTGGHSSLALHQHHRSKTMKRAEEESSRVLDGGVGDAVFRSAIIPSLQNSQVALELVVQHCHLSLDTVIALSEAFEKNRHLIGFSVLGNPGNDKRGNARLRQACVETLAPIKWFQGKPLPGSLAELRSLRLLGSGHHDQQCACAVCLSDEDDDDELSSVPGSADCSEDDDDEEEDLHQYCMRRRAASRGRSSSRAFQSRSPDIGGDMCDDETFTVIHASPRPIPVTKSTTRGALSHPRISSPASKLPNNQSPYCGSMAYSFQG